MTPARPMAPVELWLENRRGVGSIGIGEAAPRLSWIVRGPDEGQLELTADFGGGATHSARVPFAAVRAPWPFRPLRSRQHAELTLRTSDGIALASRAVEAGLLERADWHAGPVSPSPAAATDQPRPGFLLRATWSPADAGLTPEEVGRARLYSTAHGVYELEVNGQRIDADRLAPGWTSYRHRLRYRTHDLTSSLLDGDNVIGAWLADGWYRGRIGFDGGRWNWYGEDVSLLAQLELTSRDGRVVPAQLQWRWHPSPITAVGLYEGERYDSQLELPGWSAPGFDDGDWQACQTQPAGALPARLEAPTAAPVEIIEALAPQHVERLESGRIRLDFGQNISGVLKIRVQGPVGHAVRLHHAEVLENGELGVRPLRTAQSVDEYVCAGRGPAEWSPRFTVHGFRYAEVENWPGEFNAGDIAAEVTHTAMPRTGWFSCSDERINQLHRNVVWSMRDNFVDLPTDCPQRDERLGWTGDIQVFARSALFLHACHGTLTGWLRDLQAEQAAIGHVPVFVPWISCGFPDFPTAAWGDAAVIVPWEMFKHDGDTAILARQWDSMRAWVDLVDELTGRTGLWDSGFQLGDWLDPSAPPDNPGQSHTDRHLVATAYHVRTSRIVAAAAGLLGRTDDEARYRAIAERAAAAFSREYVAPAGRLVSDTPTSLALAIVFDLLPTREQRDRAGRRLAELTAGNGFLISTGFVGTPVICDALARTGHAETAYRLLLQENCPSWLYPVSMGATTIWERWDSMRPDGTINPGGMTSFNHYALGAVADFLHCAVAGLRRLPSAEPAWLFAPMPGGGLTSAKAEHASPWGTLRCGWRVAGDSVEVSLELPTAVRGGLLLPGMSAAEPLEPGETVRTFLASRLGDPAHGWLIDEAVRAGGLPE